MYGMSGGGGQTVGGGMPSANVATAENPHTSSNIMEIAQRGALMQAQIENIKADTANKEQNTAKSWQETHAIEMENLLNEIAQHVDENGKNTEGNVHNSAAVKNKLQTLLKDGIQNKLMQSNIQVNDAQINKMAADIAQRSEEVAIQSRNVSAQEQQVQINKMLAEFNTNWENIIGKEAVEAVGGLIKSLPFMKNINIKK